MVSSINIVQLLSWSGFVNAIFSIGLGLFVLSTDWRRRSNQWLLITTFFIAFFAFSYAIWLAIDVSPNGTAASALFWTRMLDFGALWISITFTTWIVSLLGFEFKQHAHVRYMITIGYIVTIFISFFAFTPLFVSSVKPALFFRFWPQPGPLFDVYVGFLYLGYSCIYCQVLLYIKYFQYRREKSPEAKGIFLLSMATFAGFLGGATNFPLWYGIPIPPYGNFLVVFWVFILGYATIRYNPLYMKHKVVSTELLVAAILLFLLSRVFLTVMNGTVIGAIPDLVVFVGAVVIGFFLVRSVLNEIKQKEQLAEVNGQLDKSNAQLGELSRHLQQKVDEQTKDVRKAYEVEHKARLELEELDKNKDQFILATQHHLRTPLTIIKGYMQSLIKTPPQDFNSATKDILGNLDSTADNLSSLVNELLDVSEMQVEGKKQAAS